MIKPYYQHNGVTLYCGDCREILPQIGPAETVITDPVWPSSVKLPGSDDPLGLFKGMCESLPAAERLIVQLGCDTDPRFLQGIPPEWNFIRVCFLDYTVPHYKGRILYTGDVAYAYGKPPLSIPGRQLVGSGCRSSVSDRQNHRNTGKHRRRTMDHNPSNKLAHPTPRRLEHLRWLVHQFSDKQVTDPFAGMGTTLVAAKYLGRQAIGIEIKEEYCEAIVKRLSQMIMGIETVRGPGPSRAESNPSFVL